jgi:hypothetical protein
MRIKSDMKRLEDKIEKKIQLYKLFKIKYIVITITRTKS